MVSPGDTGAGDVAQVIARKLLFTVGAHEGLKSGSETGRKGVALFILREKDGSFRQVASSKFAALTAIGLEQWRSRRNAPRLNLAVRPR
jgi:hypothetical protein